jgi:L-threonylcarbamoyladenylate synthase
MQRLIVDPTEPDAAPLQRAADLLRAGAVVAYPTDTLYGLAVDPSNDAAVRKLFGVKERDAAVPIPLIAADLEQAATAGTFGAIELRLAEAFWPGPLTIVVPGAGTLSSLIPAADGTLAIRVPAHAVARRLAACFGGCITATSANLSGAPAAADPDQVRAALGDRLDAMLDCGRVAGGAPSTIVAVRNGAPIMLRAGAVPWNRVLESLE